MKNKNKRLFAKIKNIFSQKALNIKIQTLYIFPIPKLL